MISTRVARQDDAPALTAIDEQTWTSSASPAAKPDPMPPFFAKRDPADVLVAEVDGVVAGYAGLGDNAPIPSHAHVIEINGVGVDPALAGRGVGTAVVEAAVAEARRRGARKVTLRVLGHNETARRLYARCGFVEEGVLREEFLLDGRYADDVLMARMLT
jgi:RimJ/RimL family protein N-acetyltransferase